MSESEEKGGFCQQCQKKVTELKKQALALADEHSLKDPGYATFLFEQLQRPGSHESGCCPVCSTSLHQLRQEALQALHATIPVLTLSSDMAAVPTTSFLPQPARFNVSSSSVHAKKLSKGQPAAHSVLPLGERHRVPGWSQSASVSSGPQTNVQVTVAGGQISGSLSSVTIQAQQYLEGMWSISRVNNFIPQPKLAQGLMGEADKDATASEAPVTTMTTNTLTPCRLRSSSQPGLPEPVTNTCSSPSPSSSAAASFFIRQKMIYLLMDSSSLAQSQAN
ncbi:kinesin-like protein KIF26A [Clinocottus analis]|uniref:kinesin-like protein KIF26A n=1 Tax=Clinocottus analis TaxID=304258 RepID=UPI0035C1C2C1